MADSVGEQSSLASQVLNQRNFGGGVVEPIVRMLTAEGAAVPPLVVVGRFGRGKGLESCSAQFNRPVLATGSLVHSLSLPTFLYCLRRRG